MYRYRKCVTVHYHTKYEHVGIETREYRCSDIYIGFKIISLGKSASLRSMRLRSPWRQTTPAMRKYLRERVRKTGTKQGEEGSPKWLAYCRGTFNILHPVSDTLRPLRVTDSYISPLFSAISSPLFLVGAYFVGALVTRRAFQASYFSESCCRYPRDTDIS